MAYLTITQYQPGPASVNSVSVNSYTTTLTNAAGLGNTFVVVVIQTPAELLPTTLQRATATTSNTPELLDSTVTEQYRGTTPIVGPVSYTGSDGVLYVLTLASYAGFPGSTSRTADPTTPLETSTGSVVLSTASANSSQTSGTSTFLPSTTASSSTTLSTGAVAGISVACTAIGIAGLAALVWFLMKRYQVIRRKPQDENERQRVAVALAKDKGQEEEIKYEVEQTPIDLRPQAKSAELGTQYSRHELPSSLPREI